jgi:DNA helicase-2/ATP-dependent DNA helicase PcrA
MNLKKFHEIANNYYKIHDKSLTSFLHYLEVVDNVGVKIESAKAENVDAVRMMTIHSSKGLEFDVVIVCNMASDRFPATRVRNEALIPKYLLPDFQAELESWGELEPKELEKRIKEYDKEILMYEERRLCYVAWTRAKNELVLTYSRDYKGEPDSNQASVFLTEIDFRRNLNCELIEDAGVLSSIIAPNSPIEVQKAKLKGQIIEALDADDFESVLQKVADYVSVREGKVVSLDSVELSVDEMELEIAKCLEKKELAKFDRENFSFSPTSVMMYQECAKRFELAQIYQMPERGFMDDVDEGAGGTKLGSFVHLVLEEGVKEMFDSEEMFLERAEKIVLEDEWKGIDLEVAKGLIGVFWKRNHGKYREDSDVEVGLSVQIGDYKFFGLADRVDYFEDGSANIIDYKTNKDPIPPKKRMIQLGFYALAMKAMGKKVSRLTLEMLKLDAPVIMDVDEKGRVSGARKDSCFTLKSVEAELIKTCEDVERDYGSEFKVADKKEVCKFCRYKFYCPKWEEK